MRPKILAALSACMLVLTGASISQASPVGYPAGTTMAAKPTRTQEAASAEWPVYRNKLGDVVISYPEAHRATSFQPYREILESVSFVKPPTMGPIDEHADALELTRYHKPSGQSLEAWIADVSTSEPLGSQPIAEELYFEVTGLRALTAAKTAFALWHRVEGHPIYTVVLDAGSSAVALTMVAADARTLSGLFETYARSLRLKGDAPLAEITSGLKPDVVPSFDAPTTFGDRAASAAVATSTSVGYYLPWKSGDVHKVIQGPGPDPHFGSHNTQPNYYAYDYGMAEGTPIWASAPGTVAYVRGDIGANVCGGYSYAKYANSVVVNHADGRATKYLHLRSVAKSSGVVRQGELIGYNGKTGWTSCNPHLHFQRQYQGERWEDSVPIQFREYPGDTFYYPAQLTSRNPRLSAESVSAPVARAPVQRLEINTTLRTVDVPIRVTRSATSKAGIARYELQRRIGLGAYTGVALSSARATSVYGWVSPGRSYRYRVRALDNAGTWGTWATGPAFQPIAHQETSAAITYSGKWGEQRLSTAYGGAVILSTGAGATARIVFTGRNVAWVAGRAPDRGKAEIWLDGVKVTTIDSYSATRQVRQVLFTRNFTSSASHTLTIRVLGTSGRPRIDLDAFVVLR